MARDVKFSECLHNILSTSGISMNRLSKAINVDSSLVNRWVNGKRIPPYNTNYIDNISEYLSKNINNSFQIQHLNELYTTVCKDSEANASISDKIKKILLEAQGYSIECRKIEMKTNKTNTDGKKRAFKPLNNYHAGFEHVDSILSEKLAEYIDPICCMSLSSEDRIISGSKNVLSVFHFLLEAAANKTPDDNNTICISFINDFDLTSQKNDSLKYCKKALLAAINRGWNILYLLRLNNNINRTIRFISFALPLMKTGRFNPYYSIRQDNLNTGRELLVVPGIGALISLPTKVNSKIDHAFFFKSTAAASIFFGYFNMLLETFAEPLVKYYTPDNALEYDNLLTKSEEKMGNRFMYRRNLNVAMLPEKLYKKLLKRKKLNYCEILKASEHYKRQVSAFLSNVYSYQYKDIYSIDSVIELIESGKLCFYCNAEIEAIDLSAKDIIALLQNIIYLLETYNNYNIAFTPKSFDSITDYMDYSCIVKERQALLLEAYAPSKNTPEVRLSIEEPLMVKAFDEFFDSMWDQITPENKNKENIINWIQLQIDMLKSSD